MSHRANLATRRGTKALLVAAATALSALTVSTAHAATPSKHAVVTPNTYGTFTTSTWTNGLKIRTGPGTGYTAVGEAYPGQSLTDYCYAVGTTVNGNVFWDRIKDNATGVTGYVSEYYLNNQSQTLPC